MPRFYSPEWVTAFNEAVTDLDIDTVDTGTSLVADGGQFQVAQVVHGAPDGELRVTLVVEDGHVSLELDQPPPAASDAPAAEPHVTVSLSYDDAAALSRGQLDPAEALGAGKVRVRGDLSVLVAGHTLLAAAADRLADLQAATTY